MLVHDLILQGKNHHLALCGREKVLYDQLKNQVLRYRDFFYQQGVRTGDNVGLFSKNSPEFIYSYMAITSLGAVVVPLNFQLVLRELAYIIQDAKIKTLITMNRLDLAEDLGNYGYTETVNQLVIPEFSISLDKSIFGAAPCEPIAEDSVCVIIYTSGTTGNPKGAMLSHKNLISNASSFTKKIPVGNEDRVLCVLPMYHCFAWTCAVLATLLHGATVVIADVFSKEVISTIRDKGVTIMYGVPAMYSLLTSWGEPDDLAGVNIFISGGASLPEAVAEQFEAKHRKKVIEGYGLSEASPVVCVNPLEKTKLGSIGQVLPDITVRIVDSDGKDVTPGTVGEIIVQGPNVMRGYYNLPAETAAAIRDCWLHTGDLASQDAEGYFFIKDRLKDMIISGGENIYPREIEEVLHAHPFVADVAVVGVPDKLRGQTPIAFIVMVDGQTLNNKVMRQYMKTQLAAYKVPKVCTPVDALPKNSIGKVLKLVLREQAKTLMRTENIV